jgi:hypothetical protein
MNSVACAKDITSGNPFQTEMQVASGFCLGKSGGKFLKGFSRKAKDFSVWPAILGPFAAGN